MSRILLGWSLLLAGIFCLLQQPMPRAYWQSRAQVATAASCSAPTLNGTARTTGSVYTNPNVLAGLTTSGGNRLIYAVASINGVVGGDTVTFSDAASLNVLTFSQRTISVSGNPIVSAVAIASGALTADVITVSVAPGLGVNYMEAFAIGIAGSNTTTKFDANGSIPNPTVSGPLSLSTSHNCDLILAAFRAAGPIVTPDAGWTTAVNIDFGGMEYLPVTSTQSGLAPTGGLSYNGAIGDAIVSP